MILGQRIGPFEIVSELGHGAMGAVYKAVMHHNDKKILVALKFVAGDAVYSASGLRRFVREGEILKRLRHPHIVRLLATGRAHHRSFIAMEFVDGESFDHVLARRERIGWEEAVAYAEQLCDALQHAHEKGVIHRDLKPSNLMLNKAGQMKLTDFGIAKDLELTALTNANHTVGTASYMSPEQCRGTTNLTAKSDLYSLGVVLFELITGRKPFAAESPVEMFLKHAEEIPPRPSSFVNDLPVWLDNLILFLLEKKPENRPLDAATVKNMLVDIENKVQAQQSLGVEVANARRIDRPVNATGANEDDVVAVRALKKKRRRKKNMPARGPRGPWLAVIALVGIVGLAVWLAWPESLDRAYTRVETASPDDKKDEALRFLTRFGDRSDPKVDDVRTQFRDLTAKKFESALGNRFRRKMVHAEEEFDKEAYDLIMSAMTAESTGQIRRAVECWTAARDRLPLLDVKQYTDEAAVRLGAWRWVAQKRLDDLAAGRAAPEQIRKNLADDRIDERVRTFSPNDPTGLATRAVRFFDYGDIARANLEWDAIARQTENDIDQHRWYTLATEQRALTATTAANEDQIRQDRIKTIMNNLQAAVTLWDSVRTNPEARAQKRDVRNACREVIDLYADDTTPAIAEQVRRARKLLDDSNK